MCAVNVTGIAHDIEIMPINEHSDYAVDIRKRNVFEKGKNSINFSYTVFSNRFESSCVFVHREFVKN